MLCGGDVFHYKKADEKHNPTHFLTGMIELFSITNLPVVGIPGNHDLEHDLLPSIPKQPLGNLIAANVYHNLCPLEYTDPSSGYASYNPTAFPFPVKLRPTLWITPTTVVYAIGLPYVENAPLLKSYFESESFHLAMADMVTRIKSAYPDREVFGIMILHTLSGPYAGDFFGTVRVPYFEIHNALERSEAASTIQAVLMGHEHADDKPVCYPINPTPAGVNEAATADLAPDAATANVPNTTPRLRLFLNPSSFSVASLDYDINVDNPNREVFSYILQPTQGNFAISKLPIRTRPLKLLFGDKKKIRESLDLNQDDESDGITRAPILSGSVDGKAIDWSSFNAKLAAVGQLAQPEDFLVERLKSETPEVQALVSEIVKG